MLGFSVFAQNGGAEKQAAGSEKLIHYGDLIEVDVIGSVEFDWRGTLNPEGFLDGLEFVEEPVYGLCRSEQTVAESVAKGYGKILRDPKIKVRILDTSSRALSVLNGAVRKPQRFQIKRTAHLNELLIRSGGLTDKTSGEINIFRPLNLNCEAKIAATDANGESNGAEREKFVKARIVNGSKIISVRITDLLAGNKDANPQIFSGDIITVLETEPVYVIGGVNNPRQISFRPPLSVLRAIDSAGGVSKDATPDSVTVFRKNNRETKIINLDLTKIKNGEAEDLELQPFDIIDVGQKGKEKKKFPPAIKTGEPDINGIRILPLTVID